MKLVIRIESWISRGRSSRVQALARHQWRKRIFMKLFRDSTISMKKKMVTIELLWRWAIKTSSSILGGSRQIQMQEAYLSPKIIRKSTANANLLLRHKQNTRTSNHRVMFLELQIPAGINSNNHTALMAMPTNNHTKHLKPQM